METSYPAGSLHSANQPPAGTIKTQVKTQQTEPFTSPDRMESTCVLQDLKSFQCSSPSEFDKKFFGEQSLLAALSLDQLSTSKVSCDPAADWSDSKASMLASLCLSDIVSPCLGLPLHGSTAQEADACNKLSVPVQAKISTPQILLQKPKNAACFDQSYGDLTASQTSWDVSLIKAENSPMFCTESNSQEQVWSPKTPHSAHEV